MLHSNVLLEMAPIYALVVVIICSDEIIPNSVEETNWDLDAVVSTDDESEIGGESRAKYTLCTTSSSAPSHLGNPMCGMKVAGGMMPSQWERRRAATTPREEDLMTAIHRVP
ncbi:unnamed protein product [Somion occarium]|uniref:Secreted protein n=1 Tax=Somion occarium TaxID=3059160 RepID=A0ABP1DFK8_9APHY